MTPVPLLVAHRGYAARYPENSLEGLRAALDAGAWFVEFDVQLSADHVPVLCHDADLTRCCARRGSVLETDYAALSALSAGEPARFGARFAGVRLAGLAQAMALVADAQGASAFVEIKTESIARFGLAATVDAVIAVLRPFSGRCVVISFAAGAAERAAGAGLPAGWVLPGCDEAARRTALTLRPQYLFCDHAALPPDDAPLWPGPWRWALYEVADPALALRLAGRGAELIETFDIGTLLADPVLATRSRRAG